MPVVKPKIPKEKEKYYVGIDIGNKGAIVFLAPNGEIDILPMPLIGGKVLDLQKFQAQFKFYQDMKFPMHVVFEDLHALFNVAAKATFNLGFSCGAVEATVSALKIPFTKVSAKVWQKEMFVGVKELQKLSSSGKTKVRDTKAMALIACQRLFPKVNLTPTKRSVKPSDGIVDAILIAEYARRNF